jgi:hypothetical protein
MIRVPGAMAMIASTICVAEVAEMGFPQRRGFAGVPPTIAQHSGVPHRA